MNGHVIYLSVDGWVADPAQATVISSLSQGADLLAEAEAQPHIAVGPYLVDVNAGEGTAPHPTAIREKMRITGPSIANGYHATERWMGT